MATGTEENPPMVTKTLAATLQAPSIPGTKNGVILREAPGASKKKPVDISDIDPLEFPNQPIMESDPGKLEEIWKFLAHRADELARRQSKLTKILMKSTR
jgi:hypothetical protein